MGIIVARKDVSGSCGFKPGPCGLERVEVKSRLTGRVQDQAFGVDQLADRCFENGKRLGWDHKRAVAVGMDKIAVSNG